MSHTYSVLFFLAVAASIVTAQTRGIDDFRKHYNETLYSGETLPGVPSSHFITAIQTGALNSLIYDVTGSAQEITGRTSRIYSRGKIQKSAFFSNLNSSNPYSFYMTYKYDVSGREIEMLWHKVQKTLSFYFPDGKLKEVWTTDLENIPFRKTFYSYNTGGLLAEALTMTGSDLWGWNNEKKTIYSYDTSAQLIVSLTQYPDVLPGSWRDISKTEFTYNTSGQLTEKIRYYFYSNTWENNERYTYEYNAAGLTSQVIYSIWISNTIQWLDMQKDEYYYDAEGNPEQYKYYLNENGQWVVSTIENFSINTTGCVTLLNPLPFTSHTSFIEVNWLAFNCSSVTILFSTDGGVNYSQIAVNVPDTGNYSFFYSLPAALITNTGKMKVVSSDDQGIYDENSGVFFASQQSFTVSDVHLMKKNKLWLPMDNKGVLADVDAGGQSSGTIDGANLLFSSGFFLSGLDNGVVWSNGVLSASRIEDYDAGANVSYNPVYIGDKSIGDFNFYWHNWENAVQKNAKFYDGLNDGIYNPVDRNSNGVWDRNEDRPDFLGDETAWCFYTDRVPSQYRRFYDVPPKGIEIRQTVFSFADTLAHSRGTIFIRYSILNSGTVSQVFDSVYFTAASDPDIGDYTDDLVGCDTSLNMGYAYQKTQDGTFGVNAPAFGIDLLQGPHTYIPGTTYIDLNSNGIYDEGTDTALDTAYQFNGPFLEKKSFPGAKNLAMTSFNQYMQSHPTHGDPNTMYELRNYQLGGRGKTGSFINPCTWSFGSVYGVSCSTVNINYMYSGDPVTNTGWINTTPIDQRLMINTGPFRLESGKPVEIIVAYSAARGSSSLNSVSLLKQENRYVQGLYDNNFSLPLVGIKITHESDVPSEYALMQNYPNPFNPSTKIRYSIPAPYKADGESGTQSISGRGSFVTIKVFDILGREVKTLVNEIQSPGNHEIVFNASELPSGIYFYQLKSDEVLLTKKMMLIR